MRVGEKVALVLIVRVVEAVCEPPGVGVTLGDRLGEEAEALEEIVWVGETEREAVKVEVALGETDGDAVEVGLQLLVCICEADREHVRVVDEDRVWLVVADLDPKSDTERLCVAEEEGVWVALQVKDWVIDVEGVDVAELLRDPVGLSLKVLLTECVPERLNVRVGKAVREQVIVQLCVTD